MWFFALIVVVLIGAVAVVASGRWGAMSTAYDDRPDMSVPARQALTSDDLETARFGVGLRGYRMDEVDTLLERVAREVAERDRRIADLERAVTPIMHGPEGAGFTSRHTYDPADFDDTGYQLPIMVGGDFPPAAEPPAADAAQPAQAEAPQSAQAEAPQASQAEAQPAAVAQPQPQPGTEPEPEPSQPAAAAVAQPAAELEPQSVGQPQPSAVAQTAQPEAPSVSRVEDSAQPVAGQEPVAAVQPEAAAAEHSPVAPAESQSKAQNQPAAEVVAQQPTENELGRQELAGGGAAALEAPLPPVPPEPTLHVKDQADLHPWFQETSAEAAPQSPTAQQPPAQQPEAVHAAGQLPESADPGAQHEPESAQGVVPAQGQVQGQLWADPGAAGGESSNGQQEQENGQVEDQAPRGRHSAAPDTGAFQRPN